MEGKRYNQMSEVGISSTFPLSHFIGKVGEVFIIFPCVACIYKEPLGGYKWPLNIILKIP
jgi:hypothetical protein